MRHSRRGLTRRTADFCGLQRAMTCGKIALSGKFLSVTIAQLSQATVIRHPFSVRPVSPSSLADCDQSPSTADSLVKACY